MISTGSPLPAQPPLSNKEALRPRRRKWWIILRSLIFFVTVVFISILFGMYIADPQALNRIQQTLRSKFIPPHSANTPPHSSVTPNPVLTVDVTQPQLAWWPQQLSASGNIAAWQEVVVAAELSGVSIAEIEADIGQTVKAGQRLARLKTEFILPELAAQKTALMEISAQLARSEKLFSDGLLPKQQLESVRSARAAAKARLRMSERQLRNTDIRAPVDGLVVKRPATLGMVVSAGRELFRIIRDQQLEWHAEVDVEKSRHLQIGQSAMVYLPDHQPIKGSIRIISPVADQRSRLTTVYVKLQRDGAQGSVALAVKPGMYLRGFFENPPIRVMTIPAKALLRRNGHAYVVRLDPLNFDPQSQQSDHMPKAQVRLIKVSQILLENTLYQESVIRDAPETSRVALLPNSTQTSDSFALSSESFIVTTGAAFLKDGDWVRVKTNGKF